MAIRLSRFVPYGEIIPWGYGVAWRAFDRDGAICYPIPLNLVVRLAREVHWRLLVAPRWGIRERHLAERYEAGRLKGEDEARRYVQRAYERGKRDGRQQFIEETLAEIKTWRQSGAD